MTPPIVKVSPLPTGVKVILSAHNPGGDGLGQGVVELMFHLPSNVW